MGAALLQHQDRQGRVRPGLREEAIIHCCLRNGVIAWEDTNARGVWLSLIHISEPTRLALI
eukprot:4637373-Alexandrium_andersonii.AAC.1